MDKAFAKKTSWTYEDYLALDSDKRYEIIEGELMMMAPSPDTKHQTISLNIGFKLFSFVKEKNIGKIFLAPYDVVFDKKNVFQPDIIFVSIENSKIIKEKCIKGTPDLIVEIVSKSTAYNDLILKKKLYAEKGLRNTGLLS